MMLLRFGYIRSDIDKLAILASLLYSAASSGAKIIKISITSTVK